MKQKLKSGDEYDVVLDRRIYKYLQRAGVASRIKRSLRRRLRREGKPELPSTECRPYYCPTSGDEECCGLHGGFEVCCDAPEQHWVMTESHLRLRRLLRIPVPGPRR